MKEKSKPEDVQKDGGTCEPFFGWLNSALEKMGVITRPVLPDIAEGGRRGGELRWHHVSKCSRPLLMTKDEGFFYCASTGPCRDRSR